MRTNIETRVSQEHPGGHPTVPDPLLNQHLYRGNKGNRVSTRGQVQTISANHSDAEVRVSLIAEGALSEQST